MKYKLICPDGTKILSFELDEQAGGELPIGYQKLIANANSPATFTFEIDNFIYTGVKCFSYYNNDQRQFADDGTMLDENGNRSIFDDVDK